jgi:hypothetical protein
VAGEGRCGLTEYKVCRVHWLDTSTRTGWHNKDEIDGIVSNPDYEVHSLGWLIEDNDKYIVLAMSVSKYHSCEILTIPRPCIVDIWIQNDEKEQPNG